MPARAAVGAGAEAVPGRGARFSNLLLPRDPVEVGVLGRRLVAVVRVAVEHVAERLLVRADLQRAAKRGSRWVCDGSVQKRGPSSAAGRAACAEPGPEQRRERQGGRALFEASSSNEPSGISSG